MLTVPRVGKIRPGDQPQQGRLAATGRPEHREEFVAPDVEGHALERRHRATVVASESLLDIGETNDRAMFAHRRAPRRRAGRRLLVTWV